MQNDHTTTPETSTPRFPINVSNTTPEFLELVSKDLTHYLLLANQQADAWKASQKLGEAYQTLVSVTTHSEMVIHMLNRIAKNNPHCVAAIRDCTQLALLMSAMCDAQMTEDPTNTDAALSQLDNPDSYTDLAMLHCIREISSGHFESFTNADTPAEHRPWHYLLYKNNCQVMFHIADNLIEREVAPNPDLMALIEPYRDIDERIREFQMNNLELILSLNPPIYSEAIAELGADPIAHAAVSMLHENNDTNVVTMNWSTHPDIMTAYILDGNIHAKFAHEPYYCGTPIETAVHHMSYLEFESEYLKPDHDTSPEMVAEFREEIARSIELTDQRLKAGSHCASDRQIAGFLNHVAELTADNISTSMAIRAITDWNNLYHQHIKDTWTPPYQLVTAEQVQEVVDAATAAGISPFLIRHITEAMEWNPNSTHAEQYRLPWAQTEPTLRQLATITRSRNGFDGFMRALGYEPSYPAAQDLIAELYPQYEPPSPQHRET